jgi:diketogulonate reductase-like aldo/keto reductase
VLAGIAGAHGKSVAQVILRWHVQLGNVAIPKSATPARIQENANVFDFELSAAEMDAIRGLDRGERTGFDPDTFS